MGMKQPCRWSAGLVRQYLQRKSHQQPGHKGLLLLSISQTGPLRTLLLQDVNNEESVLWCKFTICLDCSPSQSLWSLAAHYDSPEGVQGRACSSKGVSRRSPPVALPAGVCGTCRTVMGKVCLWASGTLPCPRGGVMF